MMFSLQVRGTGKGLWISVVQGIFAMGCMADPDKLDVLF